jgi:DNA-binding MurR/RpiR family transcriptional regulator
VKLTPAEIRVTRALLADYPAAGLQSIASLAGAAGVSGPTVLRLVTKLGFTGYPELQAALRAELSARTSGPLDSLTAGPPGEPLPGRAAHSIGQAVHESLAGQDPDELSAAIGLLMDPSRTVLASGGRFSWTLAAHLATFLGLLRPGVRYVDTDSRSSALLDVGPASTVIVFDYRRYQRDTIAFGRAAVGRGATMIVCTDAYLSPLASLATVLLTSVVDGSPPFVTLTPAMALVETIVLGVVERGGDSARTRIAAYEGLNSGVVDSGPPQDDGGPPPGS